MERLKRRLIRIALAIVLTLTIGTVGFVVIAGYPPFDAFYMSLITITTVGYTELHPLSRNGRIFNSLLVLFGVSVMFYAIGVMTQTIIEMQLGEFFGKRRTKRMIDKLKDHYIVCGFGRVGRGAAAELLRSGVPFVVVDRHPDKVERVTKGGMLGMLADATSNETLRELGIIRAKGVIAALASDADNLFLILSAKALNPSLRVASRVSEEESEHKLRLAGADAVFRPYTVTGYRLAQAILRPYVFEFLDFTTPLNNVGLNVGIEQVQVVEGSEFVSRSLRDMQLRRDLGVIVLAIRRVTGEMFFNPSADAVIHGGDYLIAMGDLDHLRQLEKLLSEVRA
jgi:voltage-gated potassium channel